MLKCYLINNKKLIFNFLLKKMGNNNIFEKISLIKKKTNFLK